MVESADGLEERNVECPHCHTKNQEEKHMHRKYREITALALLITLLTGCGDTGLSDNSSGEPENPTTSDTIDETGSAVFRKRFPLRIYIILHRRGVLQVF